MLSLFLIWGDECFWVVIRVDESYLLVPWLVVCLVLGVMVSLRPTAEISNRYRQMSIDDHAAGEVTVKLYHSQISGDDTQWMLLGSLPNRYIHQCQCQCNAINLGKPLAAAKRSAHVLIRVFFMLLTLSVLPTRGLGHLMVNCWSGCF